SHFTGNSSEDLVGRVNHKPLVLHVSGFGAERFGHVEPDSEGLAALFHGRWFSGGTLLGGGLNFAAGPAEIAAKPTIVRNRRRTGKSGATIAGPCSPTATLSTPATTPTCSSTS